jgi:hypothetical protein
MSAPILDRPPLASQSAARRDRPFVLVMTALLVAAVGIGVAVAVADRQPARPAMAATAATAPAPVDSGGPAAPAADQGAERAGNAAVLPDGVHHALIRKVDVAGERITVDVVQRFVDDAAEKAAREDGKSPEEAQWTTVWLRNENPRLRTLPVAADLRVDFFEPCDEQPDRRAVLRRLAANARRGQYFYSMTVRDGAVHALVERQITPAC